MGDVRPDLPGENGLQAGAFEGFFQDGPDIAVLTGEEGFGPGPEKQGIGLFPAPDDAFLLKPVFRFQKRAETLEKRVVALIIFPEAADDVAEKSMGPEGVHDRPGLFDQLLVEFLIQPGAGAFP